MMSISGPGMRVPPGQQYQQVQFAGKRREAKKLAAMRDVLALLRKTGKPASPTNERRQQEFSTIAREVRVQKVMKEDPATPANARIANAYNNIATYADMLEYRTRLDLSGADADLIQSHIEDQQAWIEFYEKVKEDLTPEAGRYDPGEGILAKIRRFGSPKTRSGRQVWGEMGKIAAYGAAIGVASTAGLPLLPVVGGYLVADAASSRFQNHRKIALQQEAYRQEAERAFMMQLEPEIRQGLYPEGTVADVEIVKRDKAERKKDGDKQPLLIVRDDAAGRIQIETDRVLQLSLPSETALAIRQLVRQLDAGKQRVVITIRLPERDGDL